MRKQQRSTEDENDAFAAGDAGAALTYPAAYNALRKGGHVIIDDRPCRVVDVRTFKVGKHGHGKVAVVGIDIFTDKRREVVQPSTHTAQVPIVNKQEYTLVDAGAVHMSLLDDKGIMKSDIRVPEDKALADDIKDKLTKDQSVMITILSAMDEEKVIGCKAVRD